MILAVAQQPARIDLAAAGVDGRVLEAENVPVGAGTVLAYAACLVVILAATIRLANPPG